MSKPLVGVIIPTRNRAEFLRRAIASVLNQTYQHFDVFVIDDASDDITPQVITGFGDNRIKYYRHQIKKGGSAARNTGI